MRAMARVREKSLTRLLLTHEIIFLVLIALTGAVGGLWVYFWRQASVESVEINSLLSEAQRLRGDLYRQVREIYVASRARDPRALDLYWNHIYEIDLRFNHLEARVRGEDAVNAVRAMRTAYQMLQIEMNQVLADPAGADETLRQRILEPAYDSWLQGGFELAFERLNELIAAHQHQLEARLKRANRLASWTLPLPLLLALALLLYSHRNLREHFAGPMRRLTEGAEQISRGRPAQPIPEQGVAEVALLARTINTMAADLAASQERLIESERQAALGALVPVVAHNIRNPLASIRAAAQLLDDPEDVEELKETGAAIVATVDRLERWVAALLTYLHPLKPHRRSTSLSAVIDGALAPLESKIREKNTRIIKSRWDEDRTLAVDVDLLEQAVHGLLLNALEAAPVDSKIQLTLAPKATTMDLLIDDEGPGMQVVPDPRDLSPGPTTKRTGTGLGIPFAYKICQAHGGTLAFETAPGGGTRVRISLPVEREPAAQ